MSAIRDHKRYFDSKRFIAQQTGSTGWGVFAETDFEEGDAIFWLSLQENTPESSIIKWIDSFGPCFERGYTVVPDFGYCCTPDNVFWNLNHSCNPNAGFANWSRIEDNAIPIVAYRHIWRGEQITSDYSTFTVSYEGTLEGAPWSMTPCLCGEPNCRGTITGFEALPHDLQLSYLLAEGKAPGRVLAHIVHDLPHLEAELRDYSFERYVDYHKALAGLYAKSVEFQRTIGPSRSPSPEASRLIR